MMRLFQKFLKPVIVIGLGWFAFFGGILINDSTSTVAILLEAIARGLP